jgi:hypothetical protein
VYLALRFVAIEGADLLATIARRWVAATETLPQKAMRAEAADIAATFLAQWCGERGKHGDA